MAKRNKQKCREATKRWADKNPEKLISGRLFYKYGITLEQKRQKLLDQKGLCPICLTTIQEKKFVWAVDHDHLCCPRAKSCGKCIRDILCSKCNIGLGNFRDNSELLRAAASYIERWNRVN